MYHVEFTSNAEADLARLSKSVTQLVFKRLHWLAENFETIKPEQLTGEWQGVFKLRIGDYPALYTFTRDKRNIIVHFVKHRREVYKIRREKKGDF